MKPILGLLLAIGILGCAIVFGPGCAHWHDDWEAKCGPQVDPALMPCPCMNPLTPDCPPPPSDDIPPWAQNSKKPTVKPVAKGTTP
jgi:hypothetical protein